MSCNRSIHRGDCTSSKTSSLSQCMRSLGYGRGAVLTDGSSLVKSRYVLAENTGQPSEERRSVRFAGPLWTSNVTTREICAATARQCMSVHCHDNLVGSNIIQHCRRHLRASTAQPAAERGTRSAT